MCWLRQKIEVRIIVVRVDHAHRVGVLEVAQDALEDIKVCMSEASVKDLIQIFNSAVKTHRDLMSDIVAIQDKETKEEQTLAKEYSGKVDELLKKISGS